ncbi:MAG: hypothetical protein ACOX3Q_03985 [Clostridia bacterium]|jgi:hypothetical protein
MSEYKELMALKEKAMSRRRDVIFDNDGGDVFYYSSETKPEDLLRSRTVPALDAGVDTYVYTTGWGFGIGLHDSKVGSVLTTKRGIAKDNKTGDFLKLGTDCLRITSEYVKKRGVEFFWGMRMNDTHDAGYDNIHMDGNKFKQENPDVWFGKGIKHGAYTAVDYKSEKVREFALAYIMDTVDRYDIDGVFLDFFRHPIFFRSNAMGEKATEEETNLMTDFMEKVYLAMNERRLRDQKYYLIAVRVPDSVEYSLAIGLDIEKWLKKGLVDLFSVASYLQFNDWTYSADLAKKYDVPVYPSLDESRVQDAYSRYKRNCLKAYYGRIMHVWDSGCNGVFMFNNSGLKDPYHNVVPNNWFLDDAGDFRKALEVTARGKDFVNTLSKRYFTSFRGSGRVAGGSLPHARYINIPVLNRKEPIETYKGPANSIPIRISDDLDENRKNRIVPKATFFMTISEQPNDLQIRCNGIPLSYEFTYLQDENADTGQYLLKGILPDGSLRKGQNEFVVSGQSLSVYDLWIDLDYE